MNIDFTPSFNAKGLEAARFTQFDGRAEGLENVSDRRALAAPSALTVTASESSLVDEIERVSENDLRRDDDLGRLVMSAFDFKAPQMPEFV